MRGVALGGRPGACFTVSALPREAGAVSCFSVSPVGAVGALFNDRAVFTDFRVFTVFSFFTVFTVFGRFAVSAFLYIAFWPAP